MSLPPIITLITDFGIKDYAVGAVKGAIYTELPQARVVDITHEISPFNITETAYILKNAYKNFPRGSIHIVGVDAELTNSKIALALLLDHHYFICPDNGLLSLIALDINPEKMVEITVHNPLDSSFPVLDVFVRVACFIAKGGKLEVVGKPVHSYKKILELQPKISPSSITGNVIYTDNYGNVVSNISRKLFKEVGKGRPFKIAAKGCIFTKIYPKYNAIENKVADQKNRQDGEKLALFNTSGFLEIAIYRSNLKTVGGACSLLGLQYRDIVSVDFF